MVLHHSYVVVLCAEVRGLPLLTDRLVGTTSIFYFALLTGRAFSLCTAIGDQIPFEAVYDAQNINWTAAHDKLSLLPDSVRRPNGDALRGSPDSVGPKHQHWNLLNPEENAKSKEIFDLFTSGNLSNLGAEKEILLFTLNRGVSVRLFDNPYHAQQLRAIGLTPETAFGCAMEFLFKPNPVMQDMMQPSLNVLAPVLSIGIHIRAGDHVFQHPDAMNLDDARNFFECALQVEADLRRRHKAKYNKNDIKWFFLSDSVKLRQSASELYKRKIHTMAGMLVEHTFGEHGVGEKPSASQEGFLTAASEHWLFGLMDVHIVDANSGFGQSGAMRTFLDGDMYVVDRGKEPRCQKDRHVSIKEIGHMRGGI